MVCRVSTGNFFYLKCRNFPSYNLQAKALTEAKQELPHLKLVNAQCLQQVLKRLDKAWTDFFKREFDKIKKQQEVEPVILSALNQD